MGLIIRNDRFYGNNPSHQLVNYSTEEQIIGTWIDGKPIYQKTIDCGAGPTGNNTAKSVAHNIANIDKVISYDGISFYSDGETFIKIPDVMNSDTNGTLGNLTIQVRVTINKTNISLVSAGDRSSVFAKIYITVQYTKTTD